VSATNAELREPTGKAAIACWKPATSRLTAAWITVLGVRSMLAMLGGSRGQASTRRRGVSPVLIAAHRPSSSSC